MAFQTSLNANPAVAVEGDFCSSNPRASMLAGPGALTAGAAGVTVGLFAFARNDTGVVSNAHPGVASRLGFVGRDSSPALITTWLGNSTMTINAGLGVTLYDSADVWAGFAAGAAIGQKVFADYLTGAAVAGTAGVPPTAAVTASFATSVMTVTATNKTLGPGQVLHFTSVAAGTYIVSQASGTTGGAGTYNLSTTPGTVGSAAGTIDTAQETPWFVDSVAGNNELAMISRHG